MLSNEAQLSQLSISSAGSDPAVAADTCKSKNILILGQSGVGKSTWINALANYLAYGSLKEAIQSDGAPVCLVPAHITICDEEWWNPRVVRVGDGFTQAQRDNERHVVGKSRTLGPRTYVFNYPTAGGGGDLRLIDTAGILHTDGIEQDERNLDTLLKYLANIGGELHGICILLHPDPDRSQLDPAFGYCIDNLFSRLHRNAAQNIVFCFTHARGTFFKRADDIFLALREFLAKLAKDRGVQIELNSDTMYCLDNEAFPFLCAEKEGLQQFSPEDFANMEESWRHSESETRRMFEYLLRLKPHRTEETTSLNKVRRFISLMAEPLARITSTIQTNISAMNSMKQELASLDARVVHLNSQLMIAQGVVIESKLLPHPRTVCVAPGCTEACRDKYGKLLVRYKTHCHPHCHCLDNVTLEAYPDPALQKCEAMIHQEGQVVCKVCGCLWSMHMRIRHELFEVTKMVEDKWVREQLQLASDQRKHKQQEILSDNAQERIRRYTEEQSRISAIAAMFASFLQHHTITPCIDPVREYLDLLILEADAEDSRKLKALEDFLAQYLAQRNSFAQTLKSGAKTVEPGDIKRYFEELVELPLTGEDFRKLYQQQQEEKGQSRQQDLGSASSAMGGRRVWGQQRQESTTNQHD